MKKFLHVFLLQFLFASVRSIEDNDVFIFANNKWCITNSSSAITFRNYPKDGHYSSSLYPAIKDKSFNCNFEYNEECSYKEPSWQTGNWINQNSIYSILPITEPITDERWESFPIVKTEGDLFVDKLQYKEVLEIRDWYRDDFAIPLSVKIEKEAHIYLCDGENPVVSNCYWIMLGMSNGKMSKIRKCNAGQISYEYNEYPTDPYCSNGLVQNNVNPLNEDEWKHFLIRRLGGFLGIYRNNNIFLHINDTEKPYNTKKVFVHSKKADGLWKIHVYNFLESTTKSENNDPLGPRFEVDAEICLSMFIKTSPGSTLRIQIKPKGYNFFSQVFQTEGIWKKIKIYRKIENNQLIKTDYNFYITRKGKGYWAVDDIRRCTNEEYRYIKSNDDDDECHLLSSDKPTIISMKSKKREISTTGIDCPENSFSTACIPCKLFGQEYCPELKYCDVAEKCYCSAGYTDVKCNKVCPRGTYGHGCQKKSYCSKQNDPVTGYCPASCETPFTGSTCNISSTPFFLNDPLVVDITDTSFNIQQVDLQYVGNGAQYYTFQYSNNDDGSNKWVQVDEKIHLNVSKIVKVTGLEPDTSYSVRAIIIGRQSRREKFSKTRKNFTTSCQKLSKDDVVIDTFNTSAIVNVMLHFNSCKMSKYLYCLNNCVNLFGNKFNVSSLTPHKEYNLKFVHSNKIVLNITFNTTDGVPSFVTDITEKSSANSLELNWEKPETENGEIVGYEIAYTLYKHLACNLRENNPLIYHLNTTEKHIRLENLQPYSQYEISIRALSRAFKGQFKPKQVITTSSDELSPDEKVSISQVIVAGYPRILWNSIDCSTRRGPIFVQSETVCLSEWCDRLNETIVDYFPYESEGKTLYTKLQSYCNYTITLSISRNKTNWLFSDSFNFTSSPTSPGSVTQLSVYSKNDSSISLRWKKPYPPTGVLKEYKIDYYYYYYSVKYTNRIILRASEATCNLWKEFHCATITKEVYNNYVYDIKVSANNEKPDEFGTSSAIEIKNTQAGPEPPYNLNYEWTDDNELFVTFYHPNNTNGILTSFELLVFDKSELKYINYENYQLRYKFQYEDLTFLATRKTCSRFEMYIRAHNTYTSSIFTKLQIIVPPSIPAGIKTFSYKSEMISIAIHLVFTQPYPDRAIILLSKGIDADELRSFETGDFIDRKPRGNFTSFYVVYDNENLDSPVEFEIGDGNSTWQELTNPALESGRKYTIAVYLVNYCQNFLARWMKQEWVVQTEGESAGPSSEEIFIDNDNDEESDDGRNLWALLLLVLIPIGLFGVWFVKKKNLDLHRLVRASAPNADNVPLTDQPPISSRIHVLKPKLSIVLPALQTNNSKRIPIVEFESYVKDAIESGELERQHNLFPKGLFKPHSVGSSAENKNKNRYKNLTAYDRTRVKLRKNSNDGDAETGYINANYIDGYRKPRAYIATQGPKSNTLNDFWWMVWQENVKDILMLANIYENGKKKVEKYWPDINEEKSYGLIKVHFLSESVFSNFILRTFNCCFGNQERKINQMHYTTWPDHGVPLYSQSLVPYLQRLLKIPHSSQAPIIVHCSAGVGRTGTIILSDICLRMAAGEGHLDFLAHLENLRNQRANLVDNIEQYKLAHLVVLECLFGMRTSIVCNDEMRTAVEAILRNDGVEMQMKYILETQWQDKAMETMLEVDRVAPVYHEKNRFNDIVPEKYRVFISRYPQLDEKSSYINAVLVDDFSSPGRYIVTQQPLPNTLGDFWRLVLERSCSVIISLNTVDLTDETVCKIWPEADEVLNPVDFIRITHKYTKNLLFYKIVTVQLDVKKTKHFSGFEESSSEVTILALNTWSSKDSLPNSIEEFLTFRDASDILARPAEHVIVTCYDGARACGLFVALSFIIEQMKLEQECDVCLAVRSVRHSRKQFVETEEQYEFLYRAAVTFITGFQQYSNFT